MFEQTSLKDALLCRNVRVFKNSQCSVGFHILGSGFLGGHQGASEGKRVWRVRTHGKPGPLNAQSQLFAQLAANTLELALWQRCSVKSFN